MNEQQRQRLRELALSMSSASQVVGAMKATRRDYERESADWQAAVCDFDAALDSTECKRCATLSNALRALLDMDPAYMRGPKVQEAVEAAHQVLP